MKKITIHSLAELEKFAAEVARTIKGGEVIFLQGDLGAGKTTFVSFFARVLGARQEASSPTFTIEQVYEAADGTLIRHYDLYRVASAPEFFVAEFLEGLYDQKEIRLVEWGDPLLPYIRTYTLIRFERSLEGENVREVSLEKVGV